LIHCMFSKCIYLVMAMVYECQYINGIIRA
jgi:hypothetical protein